MMIQPCEYLWYQWPMCLEILQWEILCLYVTTIKKEMKEKGGLSSQVCYEVRKNRETRLLQVVQVTVEDSSSLQWAQIREECPASWSSSPCQDLVTQGYIVQHLQLYCNLWDDTERQLSIRTQTAWFSALKATKEGLCVKLRVSQIVRNIFWYQVLDSQGVPLITNALSPVKKQNLPHTLRDFH